MVTNISILPIGEQFFLTFLAVMYKVLSQRQYNQPFTSTNLFASFEFL